MSNILNVGDKVEWLSGSNKKETIKQGIIIKIIPKNDDLFIFPYKKFTKKYEDFEKYNKSKLGYGCSRKKESYLILVNNKFLYWPLVKYLRKV